MALNIRNRTAEELAETLVGLTGETKTEAVTGALRDRAERIRRQRSGRSLAGELDDVALHCASPLFSTMDGPMRSLDTTRTVCPSDGHRFRPALPEERSVTTARGAIRPVSISVTASLDALAKTLDEPLLFNSSFGIQDTLNQAMDSRCPHPLSRAHAFAGMTVSVKATCLAEMTSFPRLHPRGQAPQSLCPRKRVAGIHSGQRIPKLEVQGAGLLPDRHRGCIEE